jgi:hypothetical protein
MKIQTHEYVEFIRHFTDQTNIMSKTFFLIIPYTRGVSIKKTATSNPFSGLFGGVKKKVPVDIKSFEEARIQLEQRVSIVEQGLSRCDIRTTRLGTEEVTELFYRKFNPGELESAVQTV